MSGDRANTMALSDMNGDAQPTDTPPGPDSPASRHIEFRNRNPQRASQSTSPSSSHKNYLTFSDNGSSTKPSAVNLARARDGGDTSTSSGGGAVNHREINRRLEMLSRGEAAKNELNSSSLCGIGNVRWPWLQRFATKRWMLFWMCWFCLVQGMICNGLVPSVLSTIELRYGFRTTQLGNLMLFYDIGYIIFCVPVSYFGGRHSKPIFLSAGLLLLSIGSFTFTWPQFVPVKDTFKTETSSCLIDEGTNVALKAAHVQSCTNSTLVALERVEADGVRSFYLSLFCIAHFLHGVGATTLYSVGVSYIDENVNPAVSSAYIGVFYAFAIFGPAIGFLLSGWLLKFPADFLTDSSAYSYESAGFVGAWWVGFGLASILAATAVVPVLCFPRVLPSAVQYHQRRMRVASVRASVRASRSHSRQPSTGNVLQQQPPLSPPGSASPSDAVLPAVQSAPSSMSGLSDVATVDTRVSVVSATNGAATTTAVNWQGPADPKQVQLEEDVIDATESQICIKLWHDVRHIPKAVSRLLTNVTFMLITLAAAFEGIIITGVSTYMAKYLERQFSVGASYSSVLLGCIMVPVAGIAAMSSGFVVKQCQLSIMQTLKFCIAMCVCCVLLSPMFLVHCDHVPMAGVETGYHDWHAVNYTNAPDSSAATQHNQHHLDHACNSQCHCSRREFHPVCAYGDDDQSRVPYYSPCYAGCPQQWSAARKLYTNCTCTNSVRVDRVEAGVCTANCRGLVTFLALFVPLCFCTFTIGVPLLSVVLRVVDYNERSFAMGIQWILVRSIGNMPAAVLFGQLFDISCIQRQDPDTPCGPDDPNMTNTAATRSAGYGSCVSYDNRKLAHLFLGFALVCQLITMMFLIAAAAWYKRAGEPDFDEPSRLQQRQAEARNNSSQQPAT